MRELIELNQKDIEDALAEHFAKKQDWWRAKTAVSIVGQTAEGKGLVKAVVERVYDTETDRY